MTDQDTAETKDLQPQEEETQEEEQLTPEQKDAAQKLGIVQATDETDEQYGKKVRKRINELTKKVHDKDRELESFISQSRKDFEAMAEQNRMLRESVERMTKATEAVVEHSKPAPPDPFKDINEEIKTLKAKKADAISESDFKAVSLIDDRLDELKDRKYEIKLKLEKDELVQKINQKKEEQPQADVTHLIVNAWVESTEWYDESNEKYDPIMAGAAIKLEEKLANDPAWKNKTIKARLEEVKKRIEERFSYGKPRQTGMTVDDVNSISPTAGKPAMLTEDQKHVAHRMFQNLTPKEAEKKYSQYLK